MNASTIVEDLIARLARRYGRGQQQGKARVVTFGSSLTCSVNYSKLLGGHKYFFGVPPYIINPDSTFPPTKFGEFVLLICGSADNALVLPRSLMVEMMAGVTTRRVDVFVESGAYVLQTTKHSKLDVSEFLNAFPAGTPERTDVDEDLATAQTPARIHLKVQWALITLGRAEGCSVWVPINDRNLAYERCPFSSCTLPRLPNFGFEENTRRIVQNIDVLWLTKNVIRKAFEIESTTSVYSGLLRLNDLVFAQPNNQIELYIAASRSKRERVHSQLIRPSFQMLLPQCEFVAFEDIEQQVSRLEGLPLDKGARVTGLVQGEKFSIPHHYVYPEGL